MQKILAFININKGGFKSMYNQELYHNSVNNTFPEREREGEREKEKERERKRERKDRGVTLHCR